jgi:hypothetical protein
VDLLQADCLCRIQAMSHGRQTLLEELIIQRKFPFLVYELIFMEMWRKHILHGILSSLQTDPPAQLPINDLILRPLLEIENGYLDLFENSLFHFESLISFGDAALDLVDYLLRCLKDMLLRRTGVNKDNENEYPTGFTAFSNKCVFKRAMKSLLVLRNITEHLDKSEPINDALISHLINSEDADCPMLLTDLIMTQPWRMKYRNGKILDFDPVTTEWDEVDPLSEDFISIKTDQLAFAALYQIISNYKVIQSYSLDELRKKKLLKLNEFIQSKNLAGEKMYTHSWLKCIQTSIDVLVSPHSKVPLERISLRFVKDEVEEIFIKYFHWILLESTVQLLCTSPDVIQKKMAIVVEWKKIRSTLEAVQFGWTLLMHQYVERYCAKCGNITTKSCSKCKGEWYCSRDCQMACLKTHKKDCPRLESRIKLMEDSSESFISRRRLML